MLILFNKTLLKNRVVRALILGFLVLLWIERHIRLTTIGHVYSI